MVSDASVHNNVERISMAEGEMGLMEAAFGTW